MTTTFGSILLFLLPLVILSLQMQWSSRDFPPLTSLVSLHREEEREKRGGERREESHFPLGSLLVMREVKGYRSQESLLALYLL